MNTTRLLTLLLALALSGLILLVVSPSAAHAVPPTIVRVSVTGTMAWPCGNASDWSNPCALQTALTQSLAPSELWVAAGTYTPTTGTDRAASFLLRDDIALYGGFAMTETLRTQRNSAANVTILSGDIGIPGDITDNAYHVVMANGVTNTAVLDGFSVTGACFSGMYNATPSSPTVANVTFISNTASWSGGGMYNEDISSPTLVNVTFSGNSATIYGGGMFNGPDASPTLTNVTFISNTAGTSGGGIYDYLSSPTLTNVTFISNTASESGGGIHNYVSSPTLTNVTFRGNSATVYGGGMFNLDSSPRLTNVTISRNTASESGGGMFITGINGPRIRSGIFWGNIAPMFSQIANLANPTILSDSIVQDGCPDFAICTNIITADPLLGALGDYGGSTLTIPLLPGSSAIDAGHDATCAAPVGAPAYGAGGLDQRGVMRPQGAHCDIGAFESHGFALAKTSGDNQSTPASTAFAIPLAVSVSNAFGEPVNGGNVTLAAPLWGASANPVTSTLTIGSGAVSQSVAANSIVGTYAVTATTAGALAPATFTLTNSQQSFLPLIKK